MVTINDVAKRAGVSISTVSNVLNNRKFVSEDLARRVNIAVQELGYTANPIAQNMKLKRSKTVGVITADLCGLFYPYLLKGMYEVFSEKGYRLVIMDIDGINDRLGSIKKLYESVNSLIQSRVDGIVFFSSVPKEMEGGIVRDIKNMSSSKHNVGLVCIENDLSKYGIDSVFASSFKGAVMATEHLIGIGCKRIGHISGPQYITVAQERIEGYKYAMKRNGLEVNEAAMIAHGDYTHKSGYLAMHELLKKMDKIDGVFVANDQMSVGALKALSEVSLRVPQDIKLIGYDDVFIASVLEPSLSTIHIKKNLKGKKSAELLVNQIEGKLEPHAPIKIEIEPSLVVRKSTVENTPEDWILMNW